MMSEPAWSAESGRGRAGWLFILLLVHPLLGFRPCRWRKHIKVFGCNYKGRGAGSLRRASASGDLKNDRQEAQVRSKIRLQCTSQAICNAHPPSLHNPPGNPQPQLTAAIEPPFSLFTLFPWFCTGFILPSSNPIILAVKKRKRGKFESWRGERGNWSVGRSSGFGFKRARLARYYLLSMTSRVEDSGEAKSTYRKINKQMKFQFLNRVLGQGQSIFEAAQQIGIHYSTAKTIIFFHKHHHKSYRSFKLEDTAPPTAGLRATVLERPEGVPEELRIEVLSNSHFMRWEPRKEVKAGNISLTYLRASKTDAIKTHPLRKNSKKSSRSSGSKRVKEEEQNSKDSEWEDSQFGGGSDSSFVCNQ